MRHKEEALSPMLTFSLGSMEAAAWGVMDRIKLEVRLGRTGLLRPASGEPVAKVEHRAVAVAVALLQAVTVYQPPVQTAVRAVATASSEETPVQVSWGRVASGMTAAAVVPIMRPSKVLPEVISGPVVAESPMEVVEVVVLVAAGDLAASPGAAVAVAAVEEPAIRL